MDSFLLDLASLEEKVVAGATTDSIDAFVHERCATLGVYPSPLGYRGFPKSVCTSVNNVACHGVPDDRQLVAGDIVNVDITVRRGLIRRRRLGVRSRCWLVTEYGQLYHLNIYNLFSMRTLYHNSV